MHNAYTYQHRVRGMGVQTPNAPAPLMRTLKLGATEPSTMVQETAVSAPLAAGYLVGGLLGAAVVGAGIGYLAAGRSQGAITGALAGSGTYAASSALSEFMLGRAILGTVFGAASVGALTYAWMRKPKG